MPDCQDPTEITLEKKKYQYHMHLPFRQVLLPAFWFCVAWLCTEKEHVNIRQAVDYLPLLCRSASHMFQSSPPMCSRAVAFHSQFFHAGMSVLWAEAALQHLASRHFLIGFVLPVKSATVLDQNQSLCSSVNARRWLQNVCPIHIFFASVLKRKEVIPQLLQQDCQLLWILSGCGLSLSIMEQAFLSVGLPNKFLASYLYLFPVDPITCRMGNSKEFKATLGPPFWFVPSVAQALVENVAC